MRVSRVGIFALIAITVLTGAGCNFWNQIKARQDLVDGAKAYSDKKFEEAETLFRDAVRRDPSNLLGQLFLARTLHSQYAANRTQTQKADEAVAEYRKVVPEYKQEVARKKQALDANPGDEKAQGEYTNSLTILNSSISAIANLLDTTSKPDEWKAWQTEIANDAGLPNETRAAALTSMASKENTCANDITGVEPVRKTVKVNGKDEYQYVKPTDPKVYEDLKGCIARGTELVNKALELDKNSDSIWSYKTSLLIQDMRVAEMDGKKEDQARFKEEADKAKAEFTRLAEIKRRAKEEEEARRKAAEEEAKQ
ncbi:MAG TPA: hypothetical protein VGB68_07390 [Pyrinomonadaceae bacterium]|jgi:hypothetical protein